MTDEYYLKESSSEPRLEALFHLLHRRGIHLPSLSTTPNNKKRNKSLLELEIIPSSKNNESLFDNSGCLDQFMRTSTNL